jgi:hypothetical protein
MDYNMELSTVQECNERGTYKIFRCPARRIFHPPAEDGRRCGLNLGSRGTGMRGG